MARGDGNGAGRGFFGETGATWRARDVAPQSDEDAYQDGYDRVMAEFAWAYRRGWSPTERMLVLALTHARRAHDLASRGKVVAGRNPEWLRGRADALRELLHQGVGLFPDGRPDTPSED